MSRWRIDPDEQSKLVTVATFERQPDFLLFRSLLESAGIECFSRNENTFRIAGPFHSFFGQFRIDLQVRESDADDAREILDSALEDGSQAGS